MHFLSEYFAKIGQTCGSMSTTGDNFSPIEARPSAVVVCIAVVQTLITLSSGFFPGFLRQSSETIAQHDTCVSCFQTFLVESKTTEAHGCFAGLRTLADHFVTSASLWKLPIRNVDSIRVKRAAKLRIYGTGPVSVPRQSTAQHRACHSTSCSFSTYFKVNFTSSLVHFRLCVARPTALLPFVPVCCVPALFQMRSM